MRTEWTTTTVTLLALASFVACGARNDDTDPETNAGALALVGDNAEIAALEQELEGSLEEPLSDVSTGAGEALATTSDDAAEAARANAGLWFRPAGCIRSVRDGNVVTHTFDDCTGPGQRSLNGVVTSTWTLANGVLSVLHEAQDFSIDRARVDHATNVEYRFEDGKILRGRTSGTVGETASGKLIDHSASFGIAYDVKSGCHTRDGQARVSIGAHDWTRTVEGWAGCGDRFSCPSAGSITMSGPHGSGSIEITSSGVYDLTVGDYTDTGRAMSWCVAE